MPDRPPRTPIPFLASLRARLLALALCCLLPALAIVLLVGVAQHRNERREAREDARRLTSVVSASQLHLAESSRQLLETLASDPRVHAPPDECSRYLADVLRLNPVYANLGVASPQGELVSSAVRLVHPVKD